MGKKQPNHTHLTRRIGLEVPLVGLYDAPDPTPFEPLISPQAGECIFTFFDSWTKGQTLHLTEGHYGCRGCGRWYLDLQAGSKQDFIDFLVDGEGLKASRELMERWIDSAKPYQRTHPHILIGPLKQDQWKYIKTITFFVNPDQLGALVYGTQYHSAPEDPPPMIAPFGSGCMELLPFADLGIPQAAIGATDIAMRQYLPADVLTVSVTLAMFERLCRLDEKSFLYKPFLKNLRRARGYPDL